MEEVSAKKIMIGVLALLPLVFSLAWLISTLISSMTISIGSDGFMLSPIQNKGPIVISLVMFMAGYALFLLFVFSSNIRNTIVKITHKK